MRTRTNGAPAAFLALPLLCALALPALAGEKGWFGVAFDIRTTGLFKPTLESATLKAVTPGSPADRANLVPGDVLLELNGIPVPGAKDEQLDQLKAWLERDKAIGETLTLKLSRPGQAAFTVLLTAVPRR